MKWYHFLPLFGIYIAMIEDDVDEAKVYFIQLGLYLPIVLLLLYLNK